MKKRKARSKLVTEIINITLFFATIAIIVICLPKEKQFQYQFKQGKPWQYDLLTATFDFPIYKLPNEIAKEREAVINSYTPYFDFYESIYQTQLNAAISSISNDSLIAKKSKNHRAYEVFFTNEFEHIYSKGIIKDSDYRDLLNKKINSINITRNNITKMGNIDDLYTETSAKEYIHKNLPKYIKEDKLNSLNIDGFIIANIILNAETTNKVKSDELNSISISNGMVQAGERIIDKGEIVTKDKFKILDSLKRVSNERTTTTANRRFILTLGQVLLCFFLILLLYLYLRLFRKTYFNSIRSVSLILLNMVVFVVITTLVIKFSNAHFIYLIPYALLAVIISIFLDARTALFSHIITILICSLATPPFEFILLQITVGMITISSIKDLAQRSQLVQTALIVILMYGVLYLSHNLATYGDFLNTNWWMLVFFAINGFLLLLAYPIIYIIEQSFGFISNIRLIELSNTNNPLLRQLSEKAPGTFQHSLQVANLSSELAMAMNANPMLARAGALYHDIGKMNNPAYFIENQLNKKSLHEMLSSEKSASILINHVADGLEIAENFRLPSNIVEFIETHHGKSKTKFFYNKWINEHPDQQVNEELFTYKGPNPYTKELAIVMICDTIEAASRSLTEYTEENISKLVNNIVDGLVREHCLDMAPITFRQINSAKAILIEKLMTIYHTRIVYPEIEKKN